MDAMRCGVCSSGRAKKMKTTPQISPMGNQSVRLKSHGY
jgi:hypothetical protein